MTRAVVDQYLAFATHQQLRAGVTPKQATPILRLDFQHLMRYMHTCLLCAAQPVDRLAYARDMALFAVAFRAGSRGSDLAKLLAAQVQPRVSIKFLLYENTTRWGRACFPPGA